MSSRINTIGETNSVWEDNSETIINLSARLGTLVIAVIILALLVAEKA